MTHARRGVALAALSLALGAPTASAQGFRGSVDMRGQSVATRGWLLDSIPRSEVVVGDGGGLYSATGYAVACSAPNWCYFYAAGPRVQYAPLVFTTDVTAWGLGTAGLSAHLNFRVNANAGEEVFAATTPAFQFWEGYLSYQHDWFAVLAGRQTIHHATRVRRLRRRPGNTALPEVRSRSHRLRRPGTRALQFGGRERPGHCPTRRLHPR